MFVHSLQVCKFARFAAGEHGGDVVGPPRQVPGKAVDFIQDSERLRSHSTLSIGSAHDPTSVAHDSVRFHTLPNAFTPCQRSKLHAETELDRQSAV